MDPLVLLAMVASIYVISRRSLDDAVIQVFLPVFLIIPGFYSFRLPHLPPIGFADAAIIPIAYIMFRDHLRYWKLQRADVWVVIFILGSAYSEVINDGTSDAVFVLIGNILAGFFPYAIGKLLLERDGMRERFIRQFVNVLAIIAILSLWEFRMGTNLFTTIIGRFFPSHHSWLMQIRGGFVRVAGPFASCILAGVIFLVGWIFSMWVSYVNKMSGNDKKYFGIRSSRLLPLILFAGLFMSQSRGPWIGALFAFVVARVGKAKNIRQTAIVTICFCCIAGGIGYSYAQRYTAGEITDATTIEQENAIYRRQLLDNYKPIIEQGGWFGWGAVDFPKVPGQNSIDNEFLLLQITQGKVGFWSFVLIGMESLIAVITAARRYTQKADLYFYLCIGGTLAGLLLSVSTVYMGAQTFPLFFLLVGWSQSLKQTQTFAAAAPQAASTRFAFRRVFA
jgi:hypothetical protein